MHLGHSLLRRPVALTVAVAAILGAQARRSPTPPSGPALFPLRGLPSGLKLVFSTFSMLSCPPAPCPHTGGLNLGAGGSSHFRGEERWRGKG